MKKPPIAKSLRLDSELQKENVTTPQSSKCLAPLIGVVAETSEDKYRLLEQRDRILRQGNAFLLSFASRLCTSLNLEHHNHTPYFCPLGRPKTTDIYTSKVFVGTCPDMCPEKERYMRETRNQLSIYEVLPDTEMVPFVHDSLFFSFFV